MEGLVVARSVWKLCASSLQEELPSQQFNTWIRPLQVDDSAQTGELRLLAPNRFVSDWVNDKFLHRIRELTASLQPDAQLNVVVGSSQVARPSFVSSTPERLEPQGGALAPESAPAPEPMRTPPPSGRGATGRSEAPGALVEVEGALKHRNNLN